MPIGLAVALWLAWFAVNIPDRQLTPAAAALLAPPPDPVRASDNLSIALAGFNVPFKGDMKSWGFVTTSIWSTAKTHGAEITALMARNQELNQRYLVLHGLHAYFDTDRPGLFRPYGFTTLDAQELFLAETAARLQAGTPAEQEAALTDLQQDILMWKVALDGYGALLSKVLAAISLHADFLLLGDMVTDPDFDPAPLRSDLDPLLAPFALQDWTIGRAYPWEMRAAAPVFEAVARDDYSFLVRSPPPEPWRLRLQDRVSAHFLQLNATENLEALRMQRLRALADGDPDNFIERRDAYRAWSRRQFDAFSHLSWYNPMGRIFVALEPPDDDYPARVFDVAAFQRLVFLAYQIRLRCVGSQDIASFMKRHPEWATHPIDAKAFSWDPGNGTLGVLPVGRASTERFSLTRVGLSHCRRS